MHIGVIEGAAWVAAAAESWRLLFVVFPGVDGVTHLRDPKHPAVVARYRAVDDALGAFVARVRQHGELPAFFVDRLESSGVMIARLH